jgi:uncharacterized membrane protein
MWLDPNASLREVLSRLRSEGLLSAQEAEAALEAARSEAAEDPWYVRALTIVGAWISAGFILSFVFGFVALTDTPLILAALGTVLLAAALLLQRRVGSLYLNQLLFAVSIVGSICIAGGIGASIDQAEAICFAVVGAEAVVLALYPEAARRLLATVSIVVAVCFLLVLYDLPNGLHGVAAVLGIGAAVLWMNETHYVAAGWGDIARPVANGCVLTLLSLLVLSVATGATEATYWWIDTVVLSVVLVGVEVAVLRTLDVDIASPEALAVLGGTVVLGALTLPAPGITASLLVLTLGYSRGSRTLLGLAMTALPGYVFFFYYDLELTLLAKSGVLAASGLLLLGVWLVIVRSGAVEAPEAYHDGGTP